MGFDIGDIRRQFPILSQEIEGNPLVYLDSAATAQKPQCVLQAAQDFYRTDYANVKRGMHPLAERSTERYASARKSVQKFLNAVHAREIIFVRNATEGINLVARSFGDSQLKEGDTILLSLLEHHSNIVPWHQLAERKHLKIEWASLTPDGKIDMESFREKLKCKPKIVALTCVSNVLGTITPYAEITRLAHDSGSIVLLDAAQLAPHRPIDVQSIDSDFLVFSGHKAYGPTGIGVLYGKEALLSAMPPFLGGGMMIERVTKGGFTPGQIPDKFEAGTPAIAQAIGLQAGLQFITEIGWEAIEHHEQGLLTHAIEVLQRIQGLTLIGPKDPSAVMGCVSFVMDGIHPHDLTDIIGQKGICLRAGHHCAQPLHDALGVPSTTRLSVGIYNTEEEIDRAAEAMREAKRYFRKT